MSLPALFANAPTFMLHLERPLLLFDLEATGTDPREARIIQVGLQRFVPTREGAALDDTQSFLVDPECDVPTSVTDLTGLSPSAIRAAPPFRAHLDRLTPLLTDADLAGYNALAYDLPLLKAAFDRCGRPLPGPDDRVVLDPYRLEQVLRPRTLSALYERYTDTPLTDAHDALRDVEATGRVLQQQLATHDLSGTPADLADFTRGDYLDDQRRLKQDGDAVVVCFGKHEGRTLHELRTHHADYFDWMYRTIDDLRPHIDAALE
jgi:DNA polymerase-3 subunit epsilon